MTVQHRAAFFYVVKIAVPVIDQRPHSTVELGVGHLVLIQQTLIVQSLALRPKIRQQDHIAVWCHRHTGINVKSGGIAVGADLGLSCRGSGNGLNGRPGFAAVFTAAYSQLNVTPVRPAGGAVDSGDQGAVGVN